TIFCNKALNRPCLALWSMLSLSRRTVHSPSLVSTVMAGSNFCTNSPLGPFTVTRFSELMLMLTPEGALTIAFPIRDILNYFLVFKYEERWFQLPYRKLEIDIFRVLIFFSKCDTLL